MKHAVVAQPGRRPCLDILQGRAV